MPFCHNCGARLESGDMFCIKCGTKSKEFTRGEVKDPEPVTVNPEKEQAVIIPEIEPVAEVKPEPKPEPVVETKSEPVSENTVVMNPVTEPVQEAKPEPEAKVEDEIIRIPAVEPVSEPVVETKPEPESKPEIEEIPIQAVEQENFFTEFKKAAEVKPETITEKPAEIEKVSKSDPDIAENSVEKKAKAKLEQDNATATNKLIPLLVTISAIAVAVIVVLTFVILILLKKGKNNTDNKPTEQTSSYYSEFATSETTTEATTTEETTESEETEDTEKSEETDEPDETDDETESSSSKASAATSKKPKIKVTNAVNKKLDAAQYGTYVFKIPKVSISGVNTDEANKTIKDDLMQYYGVEGEPFEVTHTHYSNKMFVVILVSMRKHHPYSQSRVYTISLKTGKIMIGSEIVNIYGITDKHFFKQVRTTYNKCSFFGGGTKAEEDVLRHKNLKRVSFKYITPYISKEGHLCFVAYCDYFGINSPGYLRFDATAKKMN